MTVDGSGDEVATSSQVALPTDSELERAITSVTGVASAMVTRSQDTGRGRLRIRLLPGEDSTNVAWTVSATLRERFGIVLDPEAIHVGSVSAPHTVDGSDADPDADLDATPAVTELPSDGHGPGVEEVEVLNDVLRTEDVTGARFPVDDPPIVDLSAGSLEPEDGLAAATARPAIAARPLIRDLEVLHQGPHTAIAVTLLLDDVEVVGEALAVPTSRGVLRGVAEATVAALRDLAPTPLVIGVESVSNVTTSPDTSTVNVVLTYLTDRAEEVLVGASLVRGDPEHAVMRATLDALNRRLDPLLAPAI